MTTRRRFLTLLTSTSVTAGLAGCSSSSGGGSASSNDSNQAGNDAESEGNSSDSDPTGNESDPSEEEIPEREQNIRNGIPLDGLGAYTDAVLQSEQPEPATIQQIDQMLEEKQEPGELAENLAQILTTENTHSTMQYFHQQHQNQENTVVTNKNYGFTAHPGEIIEVYTVTNGNLQTQPILIDTYQGQTWETNKPGQQKPEYLAALRDDGHAAAIIPQDYDAIRQRLSDVDQKHWPRLRGGFQRKWSHGLFGIGEDHDIIPHDAETSNIVFDGLYHDGDTQAVVELNNQYRESDLFDADTVVSAEFTGSGWNFHEVPDYEMGDEIPGTQ